MSSRGGIDRPGGGDRVDEDSWERAVELVRAHRQGEVLVLTGAGVSAESGIPTFRGPEGYWTVGSKEYRPEEMATQQFFRHDPREVWRWYLYRIGRCRFVDPNPAHYALAELEERLGDRFTLVTQNVDGLHARAGSSAARTFEIHGNVDLQRCTASCFGTEPLDPTLELPGGKDGTLTDESWEKLVCQRCGAPSRPHVLWFDEYYDEALFRSDSALQRAESMDLLIVVGTSGATTLPTVIVQNAVDHGVPMIVIDPEETVFSRATPLCGGVHLRDSASSGVPRLVRAFSAEAS